MARARHEGAGLRGDAVRLAGWGLDLRAALPLSGASRIDLRIGHGRSRWSDDAARDHDGPTASLAWSWQATAASRLVLRATRSHGQHRVSAEPRFDEAVRALDEVRREDRLRFDLDHRPGAQWALSAGVELVQRRLVRAAAGAGVVAGGERAAQWRLGLVWTPRRFLRLDCHWLHERQHARAAPGVDLRAGQLGCALGAELAP